MIAMWQILQMGSKNNEIAITQLLPFPSIYLCEKVSQGL